MYIGQRENKTYKKAGTVSLIQLEKTSQTCGIVFCRKTIEKMIFCVIVVVVFCRKKMKK
jgi:hypothetical protein